MKLLPLRVAGLIVGWKSSERKRRGDEQHGSGEELVQQLLEGILPGPRGRRRSLEIDQ